MPDPIALDPGRTALLVMDCQTGIVENYAPNPAALLQRVSEVIAAARAHGMRVIYVVVGFRPGYPEIGPNNRSFNALKDSGRVLAPVVHPELVPHEAEPIVVKRRVGAFAGTDLEIILRANGIDTLVLAGISTSGVVLSTLRHAADADYRIAVLRDCCADPDAAVHDCLMDKVFPRQADVMTADDLLGSLAASA